MSNCKNENGIDETVVDAISEKRLMLREILRAREGNQEKYRLSVKEY